MQPQKTLKALSKARAMKQPLCIELFAGCFGWSAGWLELGGRVVGFDLEHLPHHGPVPDRATLVIQDVLTIRGSQFKDADLLLASPPCPFFSYTSMPWSRAKKLAAEVRADSAKLEKELALFKACFRIQREAIEAAGHFIPMVVENVRGAQPWVGRARWNFGSFYLWGDVPALMPITLPRNARKLPGNNSEKRWEDRPVSRLKDDRTLRGQDFTAIAGRQAEGVKGSNGYEREHPAAFGWKKPGTSSKSNARKAASATIAKIPLPLARWIAKVYYPKPHNSFHDAKVVENAK